MKFSNSADKIIVSPVEYMFTKLKYVSQVSTYKDHIKASDSSPKRLSMASLWQGDIRLGVGDWRIIPTCNLQQGFSV